MEIDTIDAYIAQYTPDVQQKLNELRSLIRQYAPEAKEKISWGMATFTLKGKNLVHFAAHKNHIGFYPGASGVERFKEKLTDYKTSKGAIRFPYSKPLPIGLISEIITFRSKENMSW